MFTRLINIGLLLMLQLFGITIALNYIEQKVLSKKVIRKLWKK
jgi:hypothetical protein